MSALYAMNYQGQTGFGLVHYTLAKVLWSESA